MKLQCPGFGSLELLQTLEEQMKFLECIFKKLFEKRNMNTPYLAHKFLDIIEVFKKSELIKTSSSINIQLYLNQGKINPHTNK